MSVLNDQFGAARAVVAVMGAVAAFAWVPVHAQPAASSSGPRGTDAPGLQAPAPPPAAPTAIPLPTSPMSAATAAEIQRINEHMTLLQAQLNQLELKAKIASKQREISGTAPPSVQSSFDSRSGNPSVLSVAGLKGKLEAVLVFPGGVTQRVRAGDVIDDRRVARVAINEVVLTDLKGKNLQRLAFGATPMTRERTLPAMAGAPGPLPLPAGAPTALLPR